MASSTDENNQKVLLCQLYESTQLLTQLGVLISDGLQRLASAQGIFQHLFTSSAFIRLLLIHIIGSE
ncbi:unnamed protein product [Dracunculus medinensis]|uniref:Uncharacterized protein n=1 Tax=Dracunculus medinensis TaxID=318479 RepID=A0A0N4UF37_DRAME|nr:unnamed protein product [Dracunculus medinensis]